MMRKQPEPMDTTESGKFEALERVVSPRFVDLIRAAVAEGASDVHLRAGHRPRMRIDGELYKLKGDPISHEDLEAFLYGLLRQPQIERFENTHELDFSYALPAVSRMRFNLYIQQRKLCASIRLIPENIPTMEEIYLPKLCYDFVQYTAGLILVTGPTGSGKSTTLAAMIDYINQHRRSHILTIEDPVEYVFKEKLCMVSQREMGQDTTGFHGALRHSFRQDPDIVMIGEMRDQETMQAAITLAETGHLTFSTLHTSEASTTINRIIDSFPPHQQAQIRAQLAVSLRGIISQKLVPLKDQRGRVAAREVLLCNRAVRNLLREGKVPQIFSAIQTGLEEGMMTLNYSLGDLYKRGIISYETALQHSPDRNEFVQKYGK
ncbi:MAG: type IV pilus twitching motility protein PilT [Candidatus Sumerlaeaceae bacterium]|nr:type IV pilus twitching motility protein PilT [Candidatus Sumerlaeaceae bacterium]